MRKALRFVLWPLVILAAAAGFEIAQAGLRSYNPDGAVFVGSALVLSSLALYLHVLRRPGQPRPAPPRG